MDFRSTSKYPTAFHTLYSQYCFLSPLTVQKLSHTTPISSTITAQTFIICILPWKLIIFLSQIQNQYCGVETANIFLQHNAHCYHIIEQCNVEIHRCTKICVMSLVRMKSQPKGKQKIIVSYDVQLELAPTLYSKHEFHCSRVSYCERNTISLSSVYLSRLSTS